ncbi:MAG: hypothetical protein KDD61_10425 [Bdellovibrionales bacterium]|nr:hypothetical protein [Bdellovibrionales bacterium]
MIRVLLALDNFGQLSQVEALFKKVGFDVDSVHIGAQFESIYLGLNPKVVVLTSHGKNIQGVDLARKISRNDGWPKIVMVTQDLSKLDVSEFNGIEVDYFFETPLEPVKLLLKVGQLSGELPPEQIKEKLEKLKSRLSDSDPEGLLSLVESAQAIEAMSFSPTAEKIVSESTISSEERQNRYKQWAEKIGPVAMDKSFPFERVKRFKKENHNNEVMDDDLEALRADFVQAMFDDDDSDSV